MAGAAKQRLMQEYKDLEKEKWANIEVSTRGNLSVSYANGSQQLDEGGIFKWDISLLVINPESAFNGGYFKVCILISTLILYKS